MSLNGAGEMLWSMRVRQERVGVEQVGETGESCVVVWSWWVRQEVGDEEQVRETGESWCGIGRQEGGGVVVWSRLREGQLEGGVVVWLCGVGGWDSREVVWWFGCVE
jgi:hypothetical protein